MGYDWEVDYITRMFVFWTLLVQSWNLRTSYENMEIILSHTDWPDSSSRGTNEHQRCQNRCLQRKKQAYSIVESQSSCICRIVFTYSICLRASPSSGFLAMRGRLVTVVWRAQRENMSATGLLPWYAGRRIGLEGRGVRSVYLRNNNSTN